MPSCKYYVLAEVDKNEKPSGNFAQLRVNSDSLRDQSGKILAYTSFADAIQANLKITRPTLVLECFFQLPDEQKPELLMNAFSLDESLDATGELKLTEDDSNFAVLLPKESVFIRGVVIDQSQNRLSCVFYDSTLSAISKNPSSTAIFHPSSR